MVVSRSSIILCIVGLTALAGLFIYIFLNPSKETTPEIQEGAIATSTQPISVEKDVPEASLFKKSDISHIETPEAVKAVYMTSWVAGSPELRENVINLIEDTELNAVVIDIKDYSGKIAFPLDNNFIEKINPFEKRVSDIEALIQELHEKNIYVIGRVVVFQDPFLAKLWPKEAVTDREGNIWKDNMGLSWIDPYSSDMWKYIVEISKEAHKLGFDEINYDYVRFPTDGDLENIVYQVSAEKLLEENKSDVIREFFTYIDKEVRGKGIVVSADVFGLTTVAEGDIGIGQIFELLSPFVDYISPMVYPSHFAKGWEGYENPAEHPYEVIYKSMTTAKEKLIEIGEDPNKLRPWLQDFDLGGTYGKIEVQAQHQAVEDAGLTSWMMWDPRNRYTKEAYTD